MNLKGGRSAALCFLKFFFASVSSSLQTQPNGTVRSSTGLLQHYRGGKIKLQRW